MGKKNHGANALQRFFRDKEAHEKHKEKVFAESRPQPQTESEIFDEIINEEVRAKRDGIHD